MLWFDYRTYSLRRLRHSTLIHTEEMRACNRAVRFSKYHIEKGEIMKDEIVNIAVEGARLQHLQSGIKEAIAKVYLRNRCVNSKVRGSQGFRNILLGMCK